ncbi:MAG TPA: NUDIX domain-containing protein [Thermodesulfobacteriota bacterium]
MSDREYPLRPIVGVGAVVLDGDLVLLTRRGHPPNAGQWTLPGGAVEAGESLRAAVEHEVREETGLVVEAGPVVEVFERIVRDDDGRVRYHYVLVDFLCGLAAGASREIVCGDDCPEGRWVKAADLGGLAVTEGTREVVARALAVARGAPPGEPRGLFVGDPSLPGPRRLRTKIVTRDEAVAIADRYRAAGKRLVFTNGVYDLLHAGHVRYLEAARAHGDALMVGVNSDRSVRTLGKGPERPIVGEQERAEVIAGLGCVDHVVIFDEPDPGPLIAAVRPMVLVKGADWPLERIVGRDTVEAAGGQVVRIPLVEGLSTTALIARIVERYRPPSPPEPGARAPAP